MVPNILTSGGKSNRFLRKNNTLVAYIGVDFFWRERMSITLVEFVFGMTP